MQDSASPSEPSNVPPPLAVPPPLEPLRASAPNPAPLPPPPAPAAPPTRSGSGWKWLCLLLVLGLGASVLGNLLLALQGSGATKGAAHGRHSGDHLVETVLEHHEGKDKIAVIAVDGVISGEAVTPDGGSLVDMIRDQLDRAAEDDHVKAVILRVDSPGGEVLASDDIYRLLRDFQEGEHGKPVIAAMGNVAASGGYYVSAPCRWIVANELTMTGSIGVIMHTYNYRGLMDKVGVRPLVFKSGRFKDMLSPDKLPEEETAEEKAMVQDMVRETFERFKTIVAEGRGQAAKANGDEGHPLAGDWETLADGRILSGRIAQEKGFVDELGNFETAVDRAETIAGIENASLISYQAPFKLGNLFRLLGESRARGVKVDLGIELPRLLPAGLYYLAPGFSR